MELSEGDIKGVEEMGNFAGTDKANNNCKVPTLHNYHNGKTDKHIP